jgi:hypothetical protein
MTAMSRRKRRSSPTPASTRSVPRKLLVPTALSVGAMLWGCKDPRHDAPPPGNPKGSHYDEGSYGAAAPTATPTATGETPPDTQDPATNDPETKPPKPKNPEIHDGGAPPMPANPKGSWYDDGGYPGEEA